MQIGNPLLEFVTDMNTADQYYWSHGLISDSAYELLISFCNSSRLMREAIRRSFSSDCLSVYSEVAIELTKSIDRYMMSLRMFVYRLVSHQCQYSVTPVVRTPTFVISSFTSRWPQSTGEIKTPLQ